MIPRSVAFWLSSRRVRNFACFGLVGILASVATAQDSKPVVVASVIETEVKSGQRVVGSVTPLRTSTIGSAVDGRVKVFCVNSGESVEEGQVLAQLRTETLEIEKAAAHAELNLAVHRLAELENGSRAEDIAEAEANMLGAAAALKNAENKLRRVESLATRGATSTTQLGDATEDADAARFTFKATEALYNRIKDGPRPELIAQATAQVELQRQKLNLIEDRITKSTIVAPFDGFVAAEFIEVGAWINRGDPIVEVIQIDEVEIQAPVTAEAVVSLRLGDVVRVEFPELPEELLTGTIDRIVPVAASRARTFPVHIRLTNRIHDGTPMLMAGMLARIDLPAGKRQLLPLVPKDALVLNGTDRSVFIVDRDSPGELNDGQEVTGTVRKVSVDLGVAIDDLIQVQGDIRADDLVVVVGNERLIPNSPVRIVRGTGLISK